MNKTSRFDLFSSSTLHILAMFCMLLDHMWATVIPGNNWMTCIGRIAFPIFAFMTVEGYFHTKDFKRYLQRMLVFALLSEIPFDLMYGGVPFYPMHQNVIWTFMLSLLGIHAMEKLKKKEKRWITILGCFGVVVGTFLLGTVAMLDYYGTGVMMVYLFYFFRQRKWWCYVGQFAVMYYLNMEIMGGYYYTVTIFGHELELMQQGFALLALIPIWLYQGRKGISSKGFQYFCYGFYPVHMLILSLLGMM